MPEDEHGLPATVTLGPSLLDQVTTALDVAGLLAVAAGVTWGLWAVIGAYALAVGGTVVLAGSRYATWLASRPVPEVADDADELAPAPAASPTVKSHRAGRRRSAGAALALVPDVAAGAEP